MLAFLASLALAAPPAEPLDETTYRNCVAQVQRTGGNVVLSVGVPDPAEYTFKYHVGSGFKGIADGVYDCYLSNGVPTFTRRVPPVLSPVQSLFAPAPSSCPNGKCPYAR